VQMEAQPSALQIVTWRLNQGVLSRSALPPIGCAILWAL